MAETKIHYIYTDEVDGNMTCYFKDGLNFTETSNSFKDVIREYFDKEDKVEVYVEDSTLNEIVEAEHRIRRLGYVNVTLHPGFELNPNQQLFADLLYDALKVYNKYGDKCFVNIKDEKSLKKLIYIIEIKTYHNIF